MVLRTSTSLGLILLALVLFCGCAKKTSKHSGLFPFPVPGQKWGYIERTGGVAIQPQFDAAKPFFENLAAVKVGNKWGYINTKGEFVINPQFDGTERFSEGLAFIENDGQVAFIDTTGKIVVNQPYDKEPLVEVPPHYSDGLTWILTAGKFGYMDKTGSMVIRPQFGFASSFHDGLAVVSFDHPRSSTKTFGYIDKKGQFVIQPQFGFALPFSQELAAVMIAGKWGYIDKSGKFVINPQFEDALPFSNEGIGIVSLSDGKWQGIDKTGKVVIPAQFEGNFFSLQRDRPGGGFRILEADDPAAVTFSEGLRSERTGDKYGYIDTTGRFVINPQFDSANNFVDGLAFVIVSSKPPGKLAYIDKQGKYVWQSQ